MTQTTPSNPPPVRIPSLARKLATAFAQKAVTALAAYLTTRGALAKTDQAEFVNIGAAVIVWGLSALWTYLHERWSRRLLVRAVNAPPPAEYGKPPVH